MYIQLNEAPISHVSSLIASQTGVMPEYQTAQHKVTTFLKKDRHLFEVALVRNPYKNEEGLIPQFVLEKDKSAQEQLITPNWGYCLLLEGGRVSLWSNDEHYR